MALRSVYILAALANLFLGSGCITRFAYERMVVYTPAEFETEPTCEVLRSGELAELVVRAQYKKAGPLTLSTGRTRDLFDAERQLPMKPVRAPKLRSPPEHCVFATNAIPPEHGYFVRAEGTESYRLYRSGPEQATKAARVSLPSRFRDPGSLAGFVFASPFIMLFDLTPIGWLVYWLAIYPNMFN